MADNKEDLEEKLKRMAIEECELRGLDPFKKIEVDLWRFMAEEILRSMGAEPLNETPQKLDS